MGVRAMRGAFGRAAVAAGAGALLTSLLVATPAAAASNGGTPVRHLSIPVPKSPHPTLPRKRGSATMPGAPSPTLPPGRREVFPGSSPVGNEGPISPVSATDDLLGPVAALDPTSTGNVFVAASLISEVPHV